MTPFVEDFVENMQEYILPLTNLSQKLPKPLENVLSMYIYKFPDHLLQDQIFHNRVVVPALQAIQADVMDSLE